MAVRLIVGRAGSGKTHWCQARICQELASSLTDGPRLIMLVPEQAGLQVERGLLAMSAANTLGRCEVLSFRRLARRILNDAPGPTPAVLSPTGRQMALRHLILRHRQRMREFGKVARRSGFIAAIARGVAELMQESIAPDQLEKAAGEAEEAGDPSAPRLHDTALLYRLYLEYLGSARVDPEGVLDLARARMSSVAWLDGTRIWIDGFAGLTAQQSRMIVALAQRASQVNVALLLDPERGRGRDLDAAPDDLSLFARTDRTWFTLAKALGEAGVKIEEPAFLGRSGGPRFSNATILARLERDFFAVSSAWRASGSRESARSARNGLLRELADRGPDASLSGEVRLVTAPDRRAEVAAAVRTLLDLVQRADAPMRYRDIAIVVRDLGLYHDLISAELAAHGIPFFIDRRRPTHHHPLVQLVRGVVAMHADRRFDQAVNMVLKSALSGLDNAAADALENYVLAYGLVSAETWEVEWEYPVTPRDGGRRESTAAREARRQVNESRAIIRRKIGEWWPTQTGQHGATTCREWVERLVAVLGQLEVAEQLGDWCDRAVAAGDLDEAEEHQQVWADLVKLLEEMAETLGDERLTGREFREVLEAGLSEFTLGLVPATVDQVLVGSIERSRHPALRATFVLGFEEGQFPARLTEDTVLGDQERAWLEACKLKLGRTRVQELLDERMLAYIAVTRPSDFLWVSFPESDEAGREILPSPYWAPLRAALPGVEVEAVQPQDPMMISTPGELAGQLVLNIRAWAEDRLDQAECAPWLALYAWAAGGETVSATVARAMSALERPRQAELSGGAVSRLWPPPHRMKVTQLERFAWCAFQHFAGYGLGLMPRPRHEISPVDMGSLYHEMLQQFVNELMETGRSLREMPAEEIAGSLERLAATVVPAYAEKVRLEERQKKKVAWRSKVELRAALAGQQSGLGGTPLRPAATERLFGSTEPGALPALELRISDGRMVEISGKIDRVDLVQAGDTVLGVVLDYKRSASQRSRLDLAEVYHGLALQLLAYLLVIREHGEHLTGAKLVPGGAFYVPLLGRFKTVKHPSDAANESFDAYGSYRPRGVLDFDWINTLDPSLKTGYSMAFSVYRTKEGKLGHVEQSDGMESTGLAAMLDHLRRRMAELCERWLAGDIAVAPARLADRLPCSQCLYRPVCRYEFVVQQARSLPSMSRSRVLQELCRNAK